MHEILFRGKRFDNGEWIENHTVVELRDGQKYIPNNSAPSGLKINENGNIVSFIALFHEVLPETVGQFTGLTDKNDKKIFEGDICRFKRFNDVHVGKVVFNVTTASFIMWYQLIVGAYGEKATQKMLLSVCDGIEVIGNIHDNPELLETAAKPADKNIAQSGLAPATGNFELMEG